MRRAALVAALALMAAGCGAGPVTRADCPAGERCLRAGNVSDPGSLDPARAFVKQEQTVINDLLVGLTTFDAAGRPVPGIAERWTVSPDQLTWTFHLRPAQWSDGVPMTAEDFVFSLRRVADPKTGALYANLIFPIAGAREVIRGRLPPERLGVEAPDPRTVVIRLEHPVPYLPDLMAHYGLVPVPPHAVRRWGDGWTAPGRFVSNGPFRLAEWRLGDRLILVKNPRFHDAAGVCLDRVVYLPINDYVSAERQVKRGELDLNSAFAASRIRYLRGAGGMGAYVRTHPWTDLVYVVFNQKHPPFQDVRVRQALAMAIDRQFIARRLLGAGQAPADAFVPPGMGALPAAPDWAGLSFAQRQARAKALLAQAGYGPERPLRFQLKTFIAFERVTPVLQADWRAIGVEVTLSTTDIPVFFGELQTGAFEAGLTDWIADYPDPTNFLNLMRSDEPGANYGGFEDPEYDRLVGAAEREADAGARARLLQAAERRLLQAAPVAPVWVNPSQNLVNPRITGWVDNVADVHPKRWVCFRE